MDLQWKIKAIAKMLYMLPTLWYPLFFESNEKSIYILRFFFDSIRNYRSERVFLFDWCKVVKGKCFAEFSLFCINLPAFKWITIAQWNSHKNNCLMEYLKKNKPFIWRFYFQVKKYKESSNEPVLQHTHQTILCASDTIYNSTEWIIWRKLTNI